MRRSRIIVAAAAAALAIPAFAVSAAGATSQSATQGAATSYVVLAKAGESAQALADRLSAGGATVTSVNQAIGMVTVTSSDTAFTTHARGLAAVAGAQPGPVGREGGPPGRLRPGCGDACQSRIEPAR
jgi:hypothetical protein